MSQRRLPAEVYWRRRLLLLAAVIAVVWGVLQLTGGSGDDEPVATPHQHAVDVVVHEAVPEPSSPSTSSTTSDGVVDVALTTDAAKCDPEKVRITPSVKGGQVAKAPVTIDLVVSSSAATSCTLTPADADAIAVISANGTAVWDSTVCKASPITSPITISAGWATVTPISWSGRGSGSKCTQTEDWASPGKYIVQIGTLGGEPGKTTFTLEAKAAPAPTPTTRPTPSTSTPTPKPPKGTTKPADE